MGDNIKSDLQAVAWGWVDWSDMTQALIDDFKLLVKHSFTSYTTIITIHTIKCYKFFMATCFGRPLRPSSGQF